MVKGKGYPRTVHEGPEGEYRCSCTFSLTSAPDGVGGQRHFWTLYYRKRPGTYCIGGCVGPRDGLDGCGKSRPHRDSIPEPSRSVRSVVAIPTELSRPTLIRWANSEEGSLPHWRWHLASCGNAAAAAAAVVFVKLTFHPRSRISFAHLKLFGGTSPPLHSLYKLLGITWTV